MSGIKKDAEELDLHPDAWERFERATDVVVKSPPVHRSKSRKDSTSLSKPIRANAAQPRKRDKE